MKKGKIIIGLALWMLGTTCVYGAANDSINQQELTETQIEENQVQETQVKETTIENSLAYAPEDTNQEVLEPGWHKIEDKWYYVQEDHTLKTGWLKLGSKWYYLDPDKEGAMAYDWQKVDGKWFYLGGPEDGVVKIGWQKVNNRWYYLGSDPNSGALKIGWQKIGSKWYYLGSDPDSGALKIGWQKVGNKWYYLGSDPDSGAMKIGWQKVGSKWYYLGSDPDSGAMKIGWQKVGSKWYYLGSDPDSGALKIGWQKIDGKWYYLGSDPDSGAMKTGWQKVGSKWYYLNSNGAMAESTWIGSDYVNADGVWIEYGTIDPASMKVSQQTDQLVLVEASGTSAVVRYLEKDSSGKWNQILKTNGRIGRNGLGKQVEGDVKTPVGTFDLGIAFGIQADPGCPQGYTQVDSTHYWVGDSNSSYYNRFVSTRNVSLSSRTRSVSEHIIDYGAVYNYCVEIGYNKEGIGGKGSAIFLHCSGSGATGGCVSIPESQLRTILQRLRGSAKIVIGTTENLSNS